jgi:hypothetical protein
MRDRIDGWGARDAHSLIVSDVFRHKYLVSVVGWCQDLDFSWGIAIRSPGGFADTCLDRGDSIVMRGPGTLPMHGARCTVTKIEPYTPEMQKADHDALEAKRHPHTD